MLQDFVATFDSNGKGGPKMFVKGDTINPSSNEEKSQSSDKLYKPALKLLGKSGPSSTSTTVSTSIASSKTSNPFGDEPSGQQDIERQPKKKVEEKKKSNLEMFKEELKRFV